jgi:hypothetical protein
MIHKAERLLQSMSEKQTANRWPALYLLAIHAYRHPKKISGSTLTGHLIRHAFPKPDAERFGAEFDHYLDLLAMYDRFRT